MRLMKTQQSVAVFEALGIDIAKWLDSDANDSGVQNMKFVKLYHEMEDEDENHVLSVTVT